jgi:hypothetical protein
MVLKLDILQQFINRNSTQQGDHVIWNQSAEKVMSITKLSKEVGLSKKQYCSYELFWIIKNQKEMEIVPNTKFKKTCKITNCISHYILLQDSLDSIVEMDVDTYIDVCQRFDKYCEKDTETTCINWIGVIDGVYGKVGFLGALRRAHRVAWMLANCEDIPKGQVVRHLCTQKNKLCVNSDHLTIGTHQQNIQDEIDGGFMPQGEKHKRATLSNDMAQMIIDSFGNKKTVKERAIEFNTSSQIVASIDAAASWRILMTKDQIAKRESVVRRKSTTEVVSDDIILKIKNSSESYEKCANTYNTTASIVQSIRKGKYKSMAEREEFPFINAIQRLEEKSTYFKDITTGVEHLLFKNDKSQAADAKRYTISYFGIQINVSRASYLAHCRIKSLSKGQMVRHKCLYKHCISYECLELGTAQDNSNDMRRDNTTNKGERHPNAKITEEIAMQIKQTKGIGSQKQRSEFFKVSIRIIADIDCGSCWTHVEVDRIDEELIENLEEYISHQPKPKRVRLI